MINYAQRRHHPIKAGKVSSEKDEKGHRRIDTAELDRVYSITPPLERQETNYDSQKVITLLENQVADLQKQTERRSTTILRDSRFFSMPKKEKINEIIVPFDFFDRCRV